MADNYSLVTFRNLVGQEVALTQLRRAVQNNRVAHCYLFQGPAGVGKQTAALALAASLNCLDPQAGDACGSCLSCRKIAGDCHPDVQVLKPEGETFKLHQVRELQKTAQLQAMEGRYKVFIILRADRFTAQAANSLLKILEEPPAQTIFVLVAESPNLLPTLLSRSQMVNFGPLPAAVLAGLLIKREFPPAEAQTLGETAEGSMARALDSNHIREVEVWREVVASLLRLISNEDPVVAAQTLDKLETGKNLPPVLEYLMRQLLDRLQTQCAGPFTNILDELAGRPAVANLVLGAAREALRAVRYNANTRLVLEVLGLRLEKAGRKLREVL